MKTEKSISLTRLVDYAKWSVEPYFMHNFHLYSYAKKLFHVFPFLLPHEKDYFGLKLLLPDGDGLFLDIGANDGVSALSFRSINSRYSILSVEPNAMHKGSLQRLKKRLQRFDFRLCAAGDETTTVTLSTPTYKGVPLHSAAFCEPAQQAVFEAEFPIHIARRIKYVTDTVAVIKIDDLHLSPTVVKIDAEGYDLKIIRGMEETIRRCRPILMVENNSLTLKAITKFLEGFGYEVREYDHENNRLVRFSERPTRNVFFTLRA
ncbi:MAG TPA: FkbM family methyltransferase [Terriglobia bacterium]|nr:FkbM family methyltransferase [Terriglobia bacterium]